MAAERGHKLFASLPRVDAGMESRRERLIRRSRGAARQSLSVAFWATLCLASVGGCAVIFRWFFQQQM